MAAVPRMDTKGQDPETQLLLKGGRRKSPLGFAFGGVVRSD